MLTANTDPSPQRATTRAAARRGHLATGCRRTEAALAAIKAAADDNAERIVPVIEALQAEGIVSLYAIAKALNDRGVRAARRGRWYATTVQNALVRASKG